MEGIAFKIAKEKERTTNYLTRHKFLYYKSARALQATPRSREKLEQTSQAEQMKVNAGT